MQIAKEFGKSLDKDDFKLAESFLAVDCEYIIGNDKLVGPAEIVKSYEDNMIEGRKKLDQLKWGESTVENIGNNEYYVHFTDYLTHKSLQHTHRCKQKLSFRENKIIKITHIEDLNEKSKLEEFYKKVGIIN